MPSRWWREIDVAMESLTPRHSTPSSGMPFSFSQILSQMMLNLYSLEGFRAEVYHSVHLCLESLFYRCTFVAEFGHLVNYSHCVVHLLS